MPAAVVAPESANRSVSPTSPTSVPAARPRMSVWWFAIPACLLLLAIVAVRPGRIPTSIQDSPAIGKPAPRLDLVRLTDQPVLDRLQEVPPGDVTLLHFWGTWCGPCKIEYPALATMARQFQAQPGFRFVSISCEGVQGETFAGLWQKTSDYFASAGIDGSAFADPQGITRRSTAARLEQNAMYYPTTMVVDADGRIVGVWEGYSPDAVGQMATLIERLLAATRGAAG